ncbi:hypothetical protein ACFSXZ_25140, partial [Amycolatopsis pigmentata]
MSGGGEGETTHLPAHLQKFFKVTLGMEWPEASEGGLRAIGGAWAGFAQALKGFEGDVGVGASGVERALEGAFG